MNCSKCGRKIEDHTFFNKEFEKYKNYVMTIEWRNTIRYCDTCGKLPSEHGDHCRCCGNAYCAEHVDPARHACPKLPVPPPQPVLPLDERIAGGIFLAVRIAVILVGIWVFLTGSGIAWDNRTGHHVTFPFAGFIVSFIGGVIIVVALRYPRL